jgi:hypothetical protein
MWSSGFITTFVCYDFALKLNNCFWHVAPGGALENNRVWTVMSMFERSSKRGACQRLVWQELDPHKAQHGMRPSQIIDAFMQRDKAFEPQELQLPSRTNSSLLFRLLQASQP